jgi:hypothetical protein
MAEQAREHYDKMFDAGRDSTGRAEHARHRCIPTP